MIARHSCCSREELEDILYDRIDREMVDQLTYHVEECATCHERLRHLAGDESWWQESQDKLSSSPDDDLQQPRSEPQRAPVQLAHYQLEHTIGFGGMATVYRALDRELNRPVAVKLLHQHLSASGNSRQRFLREAQSAAAIAHPNVIPIYGVHHIDAHSFLVMPLVVGGSLQQRIDREGPLGIEDVLRIGLQIAEGLAAAHACGVIHRDVKPANILLEDGNRRVLLSDFGLARTLDDSTLTASGMIAGTPAFMSPEQARGEAIDFRSDLYSLGSVLFAMATGHSPFHSSSTLKLLRTVGSEPFPSVHRYQEHLPLWLDRLIGRLTESSIDKRLESADKAAELIRACMMHVSNPQAFALPTEVTEQVAAPELTDDPTKRARRYSTYLASISIVVVLAIAIISSINREWHSSRSSTQSVQSQSERQETEPRTDLTVELDQSNDWDDGLDTLLDSIRAETQDVIERPF